MWNSEFLRMVWLASHGGPDPYHKFGLPMGQEDMDEEGAGAVYASLAFDN